ncbi:MAG: hypothetical protein V2B20_16015 [Pseudomonadota bacterium]
MRILLLVLIPLALASICSVAKADMRDDYKILVERRINLERQDKQCVEHRENLDATTKGIEMRWGRCSGGRWAAVWAPFEARLQLGLQALEKKRNEVCQLKKDLMKVRSAVEKNRRAIESKYMGNMGPQYEEEFIEYMDNLEQTYLVPYEDQYIHSVNRYLVAVELWQESANEAIMACAERDITAPILEIALKNLDKVFKAIDAVGKFL